VTKFA
jgi:hypothetical protein